MRRGIIIVSLLVAGIFSSYAQERCDTLKWKTINSVYGYSEIPGGSFYEMGDLDGAVINMDTLSAFYPAIDIVNISNDTFYENTNFSIFVVVYIFTDAGVAIHFHTHLGYYFGIDVLPNDTITPAVWKKVDLPDMINQLKVVKGIDFEEISYWQMAMGISSTEKDGIYSDSVVWAGTDTSVFYVVRGGVDIAETHYNASLLRVYPNPVNHELRITIEGEYHSPIQYSIYSVVGQVVMVGAYPCGRRNYHRCFALSKRYVFFESRWEGGAVCKRIV